MMLKLIKTTVLDASAASVTIDNIPQQFKSLKLVVSARTDGNGDIVLFVRPNSSSTNYEYRVIYGDGSAATSTSGTDGSSAYAGISIYTANTFSNCTVDFPNYSGSTNKVFSSSVSAESNQTGTYVALYSNLLSNTAAITSLLIIPRTTSNFVAGSTFYLYGIA